MKYLCNHEIIYDEISYNTIMYLTYYHSIMKNEYPQILCVEENSIIHRRSSPTELLTDKTNKKLALNSILFCIIAFH